MDVFENILDNDEQLLATFKPNKRRYVTVIVSFYSLLILLILLVVTFAAASWSIARYAFQGNYNIFAWLILPIILPIVIVDVVLTMCFIVYTNVRYHKTYYALTNKHILIRAGFMGVDYKKLDINSVQSVDIEINFFDKFVRPNTGSIRFNSPAVPQVNSWYHRGLYKQGFVFEGVEDAYVTYQKVKDTINEIKIKPSISTNEQSITNKDKLE